MMSDDFLTGDQATSWMTDSTPEGHSPNNLVQEAIDRLEQAITNGEANEEEITKLVAVIPTEYFSTEDFTAEFDMMAELGQQKALVSALRSTVMSAGGRGLRKGVTISEAKSVMDSCRQFGEVIRKNMESVMSIERNQALEAAVLATMGEYDDEFKRKFTENLERQLQIYCKVTD